MYIVYRGATLNPFHLLMKESLFPTIYLNGNKFGTVYNMPLLKNVKVAKNWNKALKLFLLSSKLNRQVAILSHGRWNGDKFKMYAQ